MKWLVFTIAIGAILPAGLFLRHHAGLRLKCFALVGVLPFFLSSAQYLNMAIVPWPDWLGYAHGFEITAVDLLILTLYISLPRSSRPLPFVLPFALYFVAVILSIFRAPVPLGAAFYAWQLARVFFAYMTLERACADERVPESLLKGVAFGLCFEACLTIWQHFGLGMIQARGTFVHQNTLGFVTHFAIMPLAALLLAGRRGWMAVVTLVAGAVIVVLTTSRGALGFSSFGLVLVLAISMARKWRLRKAWIAIAGLVCVGAVAPFVFHSFETRFSITPLSERYDERDAFEKAAAMIVDDHPWGIGANNYVYVAKYKGYSARAGVIPIEASRNAHVHNAYWLAAAETGYIGLIGFLFFLFTPLAASLIAGWRTRNDDRGDLLLGLAVALLMVAAHSTVEWILFTAQVQYFLAIEFSMIAGLCQNLGYFRRTLWSRLWSRPSESSTPKVLVKSSRRLIG